MENRFHSIQLNSPKGPFVLDEGFQNNSLNNHIAAISQSSDNSNSVSINLVNDSNPLKEKLISDGNNSLTTKVEIISVEEIYQPITFVSSEVTKMELVADFPQHNTDFVVDESGYGFCNADNEVGKNSQESQHNIENVTCISEVICQYNSEFLSTEETVDSSVEIDTPSFMTETKSSTSQNQFMLNLNLNNGNTDENLESIPLTTNIDNEFSSNDINGSMLCTQPISSFNFQNEEMSLTNTPPTPGAFSECSANETENIFLQDQHTPSYSPESDLAIIPDTPGVITTKKRTSRKHEKTPVKYRKRKPSRSDSLKSSDSHFSETSSSLKSCTDSEPVKKSNLSNNIIENFSHEDSSSPLLKRKKRKRDIFKDTDGEEELQSSETEEKFSSMNSKDQYVHQTYISDDEIPYSTNSRTMKYDSTISDFELMMQQKRAERQRGRKRGSNFITSNDELIDQLIDRMEEAAYEDRKLNKKGLPATKKVSMLKYVVSQLRKKDLQSIFLEHNILSTLTEWLSPLPSKCLPCLQIRESILRLLDDFPRIDTVVLRHSGIGRMLKFLRDHPDETKENQQRCSLLISKWIRPIYDSSCEYRAMTKKERQERDYELSLRYAKQKKKTQSNCKKVKPNIVDITLTNPNTTEASRPGEPGWIPRARVPQPSVRDYIRRPESKLNCEIFTKLQPSRFELLSKKYQKAKRNKVVQRSGAKLSIVGDKM